jgi:peptidoglycan/LPS O-acetylase OafA/YrhL
LADGDLRGRREQIDGLRVIAMIGVLYVHYWNPHPTLEFVRVSLFMTVSGFLICLILLSAKESGRQIRVLNFYIRRLLRLMPALVLMLAVAAYFNMDGIRSSIGWHLFQMSNVYFFLTEQWKPWVVSHLWSLNVVEQFYLFCPITVIFLSRRQIFVAFAIVLAATILMRVHNEALGLTDWANIVILTYDPIAAGVLLALVKDDHNVRAVLTSTANTVLAIAIIFSPFMFGEEFGRSESYRALCNYALASLVLGAYLGYKGVPGVVLANSLTRSLSQSSYATYVFHMPIWWLVGEWAPDLYRKGPVTFLVMSSVSIMAATLSWQLAEKHLNALKAYFPVEGGRRAQEPLGSEVLPESPADAPAPESAPS